jgi:hypothetical protein
MAIVDDGRIVVGYSLIFLRICRELTSLGHEVQVISKEGGAVQRLIGSTSGEIRIRVPSLILVGSLVFLIKAAAIGLRRTLQRQYDAILTPASFESISSLVVGRLCHTRVVGFHFDWYGLNELLSLHKGVSYTAKLAMVLGYHLVLMVLRQFDGLLCANAYHAALLKNSRLVRCPLEVVGLPIYGENS